MALADAILAVTPDSLHLPHYLTTFLPPLTPLSTLPSVVAALAGYLALIFGLRELMRSRAPMQLTFLFQAHNLNLTIMSGLLLALMVEEIGPIVWRHGLFFGICGAGAWTPRLEFYYMVNYYIKYLELIDTVFLALKKKPLAFLHVFHHSATALLCYTQLNGHTTVSWVPIVLNLAVHVCMYYYYYATAGGRRIWWKKYLTTMQIVQFVIDLCVVYFASTYLFLSRPPSTYFVDKFGWTFQLAGTCAGTETAAIVGCGILTTYLVLFIEFYIRTYKSEKPKRPRAAANGHANGSAAPKAE